MSLRQASRLQNLNYRVSNFQHIEYFTGDHFRRALIESELTRNGYCLFRGTNYHQNIMNDSSSEIAIHTLKQCIFGDDYNAHSIGYESGTDDRTKFRDSLLNVSMTSASLYIPFHNELSYTNVFPRILTFICIVPPQKHGQTPLANCVGVWREMSDSLRAKFMKYKLKYIQNLSSSHNAYNKDKKTWQTLFGTNDKSEAERLCATQYQYQYEWWTDARNGNEDVLRVMYDKPAVMEFELNENEKESILHLSHSTTIQSFANGVFGFHGKYFNSGYDDYYDNVPLIERPHHCQWETGEDLSTEEVQEIDELFQRNSICFDWAAGDILVIDNLQWAHGRNPFQGDRLIFAAMGLAYTRNYESDKFTAQFMVKPM